MVKIMRNFFRSKSNPSVSEKPMELTSVKVYGERNTGTHFLIQLIKKNFNCQMIPGTLWEARPGYRDEFEKELAAKISDDAKRLWMSQHIMDEYFSGNLWSTLGWKHAIPPIDLIKSLPAKEEIVFVCVMKNPYSWVLSLFDRPYENFGLSRPENLSQFLREPWPTAGRDNAPECLESPIELWRLKVEGYFRLAEVVPAILVRYEDLLENPNVLLSKLPDLLEQRYDDFVQMDEASKLQDKGKKNFAYYKDYYLNQKWRERLTETDIELVNSYIPSWLFERAGYEKI